MNIKTNLSPDTPLRRASLLLDIILWLVICSLLYITFSMVIREESQLSVIRNSGIGLIIGTILSYLLAGWKKAKDIEIDLFHLLVLSTGVGAIVYSQFM